MNKKIVFVFIALLLSACAIEGQQAYDPVSLATQAGYQGNNAVATIQAQQGYQTATISYQTAVAQNNIQATNQAIFATSTQVAYEGQQIQTAAAVATNQTIATANAYSFQSTVSIEDIYKGATATAVANLGLLDSSMIYLEATRQSIEFDKQVTEIRQKNLMIMALILAVLIFVVAAAIRFVLITKRQTTPVFIPEHPGRVFVYGEGWQGDRNQVKLPPVPERPLLPEPNHTLQSIVELPTQLPKNAIGIGVTKGNKHLWYNQGKLGDILGAGLKGSGKSTAVRSIAYQAYKNGWKLYLADAELLTFDPQVWGNVASTTSEVEGMLNSILAEFKRRFDLYREAFSIIRNRDNPHFIENIDLYNEVAKQYNLEILPRMLFALDEANSLLGSSNSLDEALHEVLRRNRKPGCTVALFAHTWHASQVKSAIFTNLTRRVAFRCEERTSRVVLHSPIASDIPIDYPGAMIMREGGKDIRVQSYYIPDERILNDIEPVEAEWEEIEPVSRKQDLEPGDRERIIDMYNSGVPVTRIASDIFGYVGGVGFYKTKEVIEGLTTTND